MLGQCNKALQGIREWYSWWLQVFQGKVVEGDPNQCGHIICTVAGSGPTKQTINYSTERIVGNGSFGVVFQATCLESGETVSPTAYQDERAASHRRPLQLHSECWQRSALKGWIQCLKVLAGYRTY